MLWLPTLCLLSLLFGAIVEAVKKTKKMQALEQQSTVDNSWDNCPKTFMMYTKQIHQKSYWYLTYTTWQVKTHLITAKKMERKDRDWMWDWKVSANIIYKYSTLGIYLRSVNFKMSFWFHRLDKNSNKIISGFLP